MIIWLIFHKNNIEAGVASLRKIIMLTFFNFKKIFSKVRIQYSTNTLEAERVISNDVHSVFCIRKNIKVLEYLIFEI